MATILNSAILESALHCGIQTPCFLLSDSLKNTLPPLWLWLKLIQSDSNSFILTQLDDGSHLEFCHLGFSICTVEFRHLVIFSQNHSKTLSLHSDSGSNQFNLTQTQTFLLNLILAVFLNSAILNSAILDSGILVFPLKLTHTYQDWFPLFAQKKNFTHTSLPTICTKKNFTHSFRLNLLMVAILNSAILNFANIGFSFCIVEFRHLVFFSLIHSKTLSLHSDSDIN